MTKQFKPMLATACDDFKSLTYPLLASPKLDGIRCLIKDGKALTRSLKPIPNVGLRERLEDPLLEGLDGELIFEGGSFQETTSAVMTHNTEEEVIDKVTFWVFDRHDVEDTFEKRLKATTQQVNKVHKKTSLIVSVVEHVLIESPQALERYENMIIKQGYEGVMLRSLTGPYKCGRASLREGYLLKIKRFEDDEAEVIGFEERQHNTNEAFTSELGRTKRSSAQEGMVGTDMLGAFVLKHRDGYEFNCGTGLNDEQRQDYWDNQKKLLGKFVKYKHQNFGVKVAPRLPVFLGFRDESDM